MKNALSRFLLFLLLTAFCVMLAGCGSVPDNGDVLSPADAPSVLPTVPAAATNGQVDAVVSADRFPVITTGNVTVPQQLRAGGTLQMSGSVTISRGAISQITVTFMDGSDNVITSGTLCPGGSSFTFDSSFTEIAGFASLKTGTYRMTVTVSAQDDIYANDEVVLDTTVTLY